MTVVRKAAVAGSFYPADANELRSMVAGLLDAAGSRATPPPRALIVPHAGYVYSGPVAASAYALLRPHRDLYRRVVLLGPCHYVGIRGLATSSAEAFRTPLGDIPVDRDCLAGLDLPGLADNDATHAPEHSLEVQLPFLQTVLGRFALVPMIVGETATTTVAAALDALWDGPETLIIISSDLSHYLPGDEARKLDRATCRAIEQLQPARIGPREACGCHAVDGLLQVAGHKGLAVTTLDLRNSGDTGGPANRVVGYGAWMFTEPASR